jgi:hypothetical protein
MRQRASARQSQIEAKRPSEEAIVELWPTKKAQYGEAVASHLSHFCLAG